jgi:hypothetical protein
VGRFPGGQTLYVELSSVDNIMIAVWVGFLEDKRCMLNSLYNVCPPGNLHTKLSLGYLQKRVQHTTLVLKETYPHSYHYVIYRRQFNIQRLSSRKPTHTAIIEPSSVDNIMIAVWVGFLEDKRCMLNCLL